MSGLKHISPKVNERETKQHHLSLPEKIFGIDSDSLTKIQNKMETTISLDEARVYVGTYRKYNEGSLFGEWLELSEFDTKEDFLARCYELHDDESEPELMFQDYENIPEQLIGESWISEKFFELREGTANLENGEVEAFYVWLGNKYHDFTTEDIDFLITEFRDEYCGEYRDTEDFAREYIQEVESLSDFAMTYFDYEAFARDLFMTDFWFEAGYVFRN